MTVQDRDRDSTTDHRRAGFTLIELLVASGVLLVLAFYITSTFTTQQRTYVVIDQVTEAQQNSRALADAIELELRNAGYRVPDAAAICGADATNGPDTLVISDFWQVSDVDELFDRDPQLVLVDTPLGAPVTGLGIGATIAADSSTTLNVSAMNVDDAGTDFVQGGGIILMDRNDDSGNVACGTIDTVPAGGGGLTVTLLQSFGPVGPQADLVAVPGIVYDVNNGQLRRNGVTLVNGVEDFQVAYFVDLDGDQGVSAGEYLSAAGAASYDPSTLDNAAMREVRVNLVLATRQDPNDRYSQGIGQAVENRAGNTVAARDRRRRRTHTATVWVRNTGNEDG